MMPRGDWLTPYRRGRGTLYRGARLMGDWQPWLEGDLRKIVRRRLNKLIGRAFGRGVFGEGGGAQVAQAVGLWILKSVFGFGRND